MGDWERGEAMERASDELIERGELIERLQDTIDDLRAQLAAARQSTYDDAIGTVAVSLDEWSELTVNTQAISLIAKMFGRKTREVALDVLRESNRLDAMSLED